MGLARTRRYTAWHDLRRYRIDICGLFGGEKLIAGPGGHGSHVGSRHEFCVMCRRRDAGPFGAKPGCGEQPAGRQQE